jgi:2-phosphoglycerate kinase
MLYILCGVAKSGKTYVSNKILTKKRMSCFSTDYLMMALGTGNPELHIDVDADDRVVAKALEPYLDSMIEVMIYNGIDYVLEGVHFNPDFASKLLKKYPNKIKVIYLLYPQVDTKEKAAELKRFSKVMENCWFSKFNDEQLAELIDYMKKTSISLMKECTEFGLSYYNVVNIAQDYEKIMKLLGL